MQLHVITPAPPRHGSPRPSRKGPGKEQGLGSARPGLTSPPATNELSDLGRGSSNPRGPKPPFRKVGAAVDPWGTE